MARVSKQAEVQQSVDVIAAKLDLIHDDVKELRTHVENLRQSDAVQNAAGRWVLGIMSAIASVGGFIIHELLNK